MTEDEAKDYVALLHKAMREKGDDYRAAKMFEVVAVVSIRG